jgi:hypothetical protein
LKSVNLKSVLKYLISLGVSVGLLWYLFKGREFNLEQLREVEYGWIIASILLSWMSHWIRAYRWNLMLNPLGYQLTSFRTFLAVMVGYLANLVFPRMGEVTRCAILKKTDDVTIATSIGSVVTERLIDFACLVLLVLFALAVDYDVINNALASIMSDKTKGASPNLILYGVIASILLAGIFIFIWIKTKEKLLSYALVRRIRDFILELNEGFTSLKGLENKSAFWISTILLWVLYYTMSYIVVFAIPATSHLGMGVGLSLLVMGGLGMSAPVQGGFGTYHFLVTAVLIVYGVPEDDGLFFATLLHTSQTVGVILIGSISFFITMVLTRNRKEEVKSKTQPQLSTENR